MKEPSYPVFREGNINGTQSKQVNEIDTTRQRLMVGKFQKKEVQEHPDSK